MLFQVLEVGSNVVENTDPLVCHGDPGKIAI